MESTTETTVTVQLQANAARLAAEELFQASREAADHDEIVLSNLLEHAATQLHRAGWEVV